MKIIHRYTLNLDREMSLALSRAGMPPLRGLNTFVMDEADIRWPAVSELAKEFRAVDSVETKFNDKEIETASHFFVAPRWHHGYPKPEDDYEDWTYAPTRGCPKCDIGRVQKSPFFMSREPRWGKHNILQLNWTFDEYFFERQFWHQVTAELNAGWREVLIWPTKEEARSVVQLVIEETTALELSKRAAVTCDVCGKTKYIPVSRGYRPAPVDRSVRLCKSTQYFGSGYSSWRAIICNNEVFDILTRHGQSGVTFFPCEPSAVD